MKRAKEYYTNHHITLKLGPSVFQVTGLKILGRVGAHFFTFFLMENLYFYAF